MWIVRLALRRPYTFVVFALLILILGAYSIESMPTDIFPEHQYSRGHGGVGLRRSVGRADGQPHRDNSERGMTTTVNDIEHIESQSLDGIGDHQDFLPAARQRRQCGGADHRRSARCSRAAVCRPGTTPPFILQYNASSVPVLQLGLSGQGLNEQQLNDLATNTIRTQLATIEGAQTPFPYGGKQRQIQVDLDLHALQANGLSPADVVNAVARAEPDCALGHHEDRPLRVRSGDQLRAQPSSNELNNLPIKAVNGAVVYIRDVAHVRDGFPPQTNIVRVDGKRAMLMSIMKTGSASTLDIIAGIRAKLDSIKGQLPPQLQIYAARRPVDLCAQRHQRRGARSDHRRLPHRDHDPGVSGQLALHHHHCGFDSAVDSLFADRAFALHETINIMTLGGMALAVGILVDDATVAIENINRNLEAGKELEQSILDGSAQIAIPALVSTLAICIVFVPMFLLSGVARYLFVPMAEAVVFAMLASYLLSRTLVPTMAKYLLHEHDDAETAKKARQPQSVRAVPALALRQASRSSAWAICAC